MITFSKKTITVPLVLLMLSALLMLLTKIIQSHSERNPRSVVEQTEKNLHRLELKMAESLEQIAAITTDSAFHAFFNHHGFQQLGFSFFYVEDEIITKWSDNETDISGPMADTCKNGSLVHLNNGWYEIHTRRDGPDEIIGLLLIRKEYAYENQYLLNTFNPQLALPSQAKWADTGEESFAIHSGNGLPLFSVAFAHGSNDPILFDVKSWLYILSFLVFLMAFFLAGKNFSGYSSALSFGLMAVLVGARILLIHLKIPDEFYFTSLFSPQLYASSYYFNSLGDLFINSIILFCIAGLFYAMTGAKQYQSENKTTAVLIRGGILFLIFLLSLPLNNLISGLIVNSKISFDVSNIFGMDEYSLLGFLVLAVLLWTYFIIILALLKRFFQQVNNNTFSILFFISLSVFMLFYLFIARWQLLYDPVMIILTAVLLVFTYLRIKKEEKKIRLNFLLSVTLLFSVYSSCLMWKLNDRKEKENRKLVAQKIETGQDQLAEYLFEDIGKKIAADAILQRYMNDSLHVSEQVSKRLMQFYFTGYWAKFDIVISCFNRDGIPFDSLRTKYSLDFFRNKMTGDVRENDHPALHFISNESGEQHYLSVIPVRAGLQHETPSGFIAVLMKPKFFQSDEGFPELFVSRKVTFNKELSKYSYARYRNDSLVNQHGAFAYYFSASNFHPAKEEYSFQDIDGYNHLIHSIQDQSFMVVSKSKESNLLLVTLFSYLFTFYSLLLLVFYAILRMLNREIRYHLNLTYRIQASVLLLVILSFVLIGSGTVYYIIHKYDVNMDKSISEKTNSLLGVLEKELSDGSNLNTRLSDEVQASLIRLSGTLGTDFNLFNPGGNLCYSSQPKIFEQGIISQRMNPEAFYEMGKKGKSQFINPESIGHLKYIAAYEPFRNRQGKMIGYLHLPYFEKENELNNEISNFLSALINIYVLLFALAVLVTLFISSRITQPLLLIQEKLSNIRLGRKNELIGYNRQDEIGELVNEYNRMIGELGESADKLARSERESAWREMAKQVAHEIKNPLTPMKLSVQHLQRAWEEKSPQLDEIFRRISGTLLEQMDTLSNIAAEFSNFAQMPQPKKEKIDLHKTLISIIGLFKETPGISIVFPGDQEEKFVWADKDQLIRVFSNLMKNAIQAIPSGKKGLIQVAVFAADSRFITSISDNGSGIPSDQLDRIFTPSFTTKSGGMGLGLSIVKSIVESSDGKIWFETEEQKGTTFFVSLPALQNY